MEGDGVSRFGVAARERESGSRRPAASRFGIHRRPGSASPACRSIRGPDFSWRTRDRNRRPHRPDPAAGAATWIEPRSRLMLLAGARGDRMWITERTQVREDLNPLHEPMIQHCDIGHVAEDERDVAVRPPLDGDCARSAYHWLAVLAVPTADRKVTGRGRRLDDMSSGHEDARCNREGCPEKVRARRLAAVLAVQAARETPCARCR